MRKRSLASTLVASALLLLWVAPAMADDTEGAAATVTAEVVPAGETLEDIDETPRFSRAAVRALLADLFGQAETAPAVPVEDDPGGLERDLGRNLRLELRYDSRGPFESHLADPREAEHFVFLELRTRL